MAAPDKFRAHTLSGLSPREAIADAVYRLLAGFDHNDWQLSASAISNDFVFSLPARGVTLTGIDEFRAQSFAPIGALHTTHNTTNLRINIEGSTAYVTAAALSNHFKPGEGPNPAAQGLFVGAQHNYTAVRDESASEQVWRLTSWEVNIEWFDGDFGVLGEGA